MVAGDPSPCGRTRTDCASPHRHTPANRDYDVREQKSQREQRGSFYGARRYYEDSNFMPLGQWRQEPRGDQGRQDREQEWNRPGGSQERGGRPWSSPSEHRLVMGLVLRLRLSYLSTKEISGLSTRLRLG